MKYDYFPKPVSVVVLCALLFLSSARAEAEVIKYKLTGRVSSLVNLNGGAGLSGLFPTGTTFEMRLAYDTATPAASTSTFEATYNGAVGSYQFAYGNGCAGSATDGRILIQNNTPILSSTVDVFWAETIPPGHDLEASCLDGVVILGSNFFLQDSGGSVFNTLGLVPLPALSSFSATRLETIWKNSSGGVTYVQGRVETLEAIPNDDAGPVASLVVATPNPVPVNTDVIVAANIDDTPMGGSDIAAAHFRIDGGADVAMQPQDSDFDQVSENVDAVVSGFADAGVRKVCVDGTDAIGNIGAEECIFLAVYDPAAGFVTGGGWVNSPEGAYPADPGLSGKGSFGFVSKYTKGANIPTGVTEFQFKVAGLNFSSDNYQWLVISGARAQFKGNGTINGVGYYDFLLTAIDGQLSGGGGIDKFRIKVWDQPTGVVIYDNKLGSDDYGNDATELGGGSIVIHNK